MVSNLSQLKKAFANKPEFKILDHCRPECIGQIRKVNVVQTNAFYSIIPSEPESDETLANDGKGMWLKYPKAKFWKFENDVCSIYFNDNERAGNLIMSFTLI